MLPAEELLVPDDYFSIAEAMEEANYGDTVVVMPGVYNERVVIREGVNLVSWDGDGGNDLVAGPGMKKVLRRTLRTIIDGSDIDEPGYLVSFPKDTTAPMRLDGFTLRNMPRYVSGVQLFMLEIRGCSPTVVNNILTGNKSWGGMLSTGLGIGMGPALDTTARPLIAGNVIYDNFGPGISNGSNSAAVIRDNEIFGNNFPGKTARMRAAPGIGVREFGRPLIEGNLCYRNGAGIGAINFDSNEQPLVIRNNVIFNNRRAGIGLRGIGGITTDIRAVVENNQVYGNFTSGMRFSKMDQVIVRYNAVYNNRRSGLGFYNVHRVVIEDNEVYGNLTSGMRLLDVEAGALRRNHVYRNTTAGIDLLSWKKE
ncbi:right-handed parallel beta-helix repeat-containing protein [Thermodesulfobacteriota bacterium B35]